MNSHAEIKRGLPVRLQPAALSVNVIPVGQRHEGREEHMKEVKILVIDDDRELCASLKRLLEMDDFILDFAHDAATGEQRSLSENYDLIILDVMLPDRNGCSVLRRLRLSSQIPVLMLTAKGDEADRVAGLDGGADDYLSKPFHVRELVARIRAVLRRRRDVILPEVTKVGDLRIDRVQRKATCGGEELNLTAAEFEILILLVHSTGKVLTRSEIAKVALDRPMGIFDRSIDNHVSSLRRKLGPAADGGERIQNARGIGYVYVGAPFGEHE